MNELYFDLRKLLNAKTPCGRFVFESQNKNDSPKLKTAAIDNILTAKENNKKEYRILMNILDLVESGNAPSYVLANLAKKGKINPEYYAEIKNIQNKEKAQQFLSKTLAYIFTKNGEVVSVDEAYIDLTGTEKMYKKNYIL